jgi:hypothetical protein
MAFGGELFAMAVAIPALAANPRRLVGVKAGEAVALAKPVCGYGVILSGLRRG